MRHGGRSVPWKATLGMLKTWVWFIVKARMMVGALLVLGLAVTLGLYLWAREEAHRTFLSGFEAQAASQNTHLKSYLEARLLFLDDLARHLELEPKPALKGFKVFVDAERARVKGIRALEWAPRVTRPERPAVEAQLRALGFTPGTLMERADNHGLRPASLRAQYFPVLFLEPLEDNRPAIGYDLGSDPARWAAIEAARDSGEPRATEPIALVQERKPQAGFLVFVPVYALGRPRATVAERRDAFRGVVLGVFLTSDLMAAALGEDLRSGIMGEAWDPGSAWPGPIFAWGGAGQGPAQRPSVLARLLGGLPSRTTTMAFAGRTWAFQYQPSPVFLATYLHHAPLVVIPVGLLVTALLVLIFHLVFTQKRRAEELVKARSAELLQSLTLLGRREDDLRLLLDSSAEAIYGIDLQGRCTFCNRALLQMLGYERPEEVIGRNMHVLIHHSHADGSAFAESECRIFKAFRMGEGTHVDDEVVWTAAGAPVPVEYWSFPQRRGGEVVGAVVTFIDIGARKEMERSLFEKDQVLEARVLERTLELLQANQDLKSEMTCRLMAENRLEAITSALLQLGPDLRQNLDILVGMFRSLTYAARAVYLSRSHAGLKTVSMLPAAPAPGLWEAALLAALGQLDLASLPPGEPMVLDLGRSEHGPLGVALAQVVRTQEEVVGVMAAVREGEEPWSMEDRTVLGILAAAAGIEERRWRSEWENHQAQGQLHQTQRLESVGRLAAGIAHEINTPLQYLSLNMMFLGETYGQVFEALTPGMVLTAGAASGGRALKLDWVQDETRKVLSDSMEGIDQVVRIVRAMKEFSHPGSPEPMPVDLNRCLESAATVSRNEWKYVADLTLQLAADLPMVQAFPGELNQVFLNLIINAAQAIQAKARPDGAKGTITIATARIEDGVEIRIRDTGIGIAPEHQGQVFDPFFTTKEVGVGSGQGLMVSYQTVVRAHGGRLLFETRPGEETTFIVQLPLKAPVGRKHQRQGGAA